MKTVSHIILGVSLLTLVACGKDDSSSKPKGDNFTSQNAYYKATLTPVNAHLAGDISGDVMIKHKGGFFTAEVRVSGAPAQIMHVQNIHIGTTCPTLAADANKDGIIDGAEGATDYGQILIPLDSDLATQVAGMNNYPTADFSGNYFYGQTISTVTLLDDLMAKDVNLEDALAKIKTPNLDMVGKQIVIYGVPATTTLAETAAGYSGLTPQESLPIACGSFVKIDALEEGNSNGRKD